MAARQRPLSEVEIQSLDTKEEPSTGSATSTLSDKLDTTKSNNEVNKLIPPSLQELGVFGPTSLESLHLQHAYSSLHSETQKARKERKKSFETQQHRKTSIGSMSDTAREGNNEMLTESEKSRKERKKSFQRQRSRSGSGSRNESKQVYEVLLNECEDAYNSLYKNGSNHRKERKQNYDTRNDHRQGFNAKVGEAELMRQGPSKSCEIKERRYSTEMHVYQMFTPERRYSTGTKPRSQNVYQPMPPENKYAYNSLYTDSTTLENEFKKNLRIQRPNTLLEQIR